MSIHAVHALEDAAWEDTGLMKLAHALNGNIEQRLDDHAAFRQCTSAVVDRAKRQLITRTALERIEVVVHGLNGLITLFSGHIKSIVVYERIFSIPNIINASAIINRSIIDMGNIFKTISVMFCKRLAHIRNHCPIQMCCAHTAKLLEALELEDDGHKLKRRVDALSGANICLARVETIGEKVVKRNRETIVHTNRIAVKIVNIDLVVVVVRFCHRRHKIFKRVLAIDYAACLAYTTAKAMLINIGVLILDISRFQLLGNRVHELRILATSHTMQIAILYIRLGHILVFTRHELSNHCVLNLLNGQTIMRRYLVRNTMGARLHLICQTIWIHLDKCLADCLYNLVRIKFNLSPITLCNFQLLLPP